MTTLTGGGDGQRLDNSSVDLSAPGLYGAADVSAPADPRTPGAKLFRAALGNAGITATHTILLTHTTPAGGDVKISFPAPQPGTNAVLLVHDSTGAMSWHTADIARPTAAAFAQTGSVASRVAAVQDAVATERADPPAATFTIPQHRFATGDPHATVLSRVAGLLHHFSFHPGMDGAKKVVTLLEYPIAHLAAWETAQWIDRWDRNKHPAVIRWFPPADGHAVAETLSPTNWAELGDPNKPVLLFVHGIFSTCNGAFGAIGQDDHTWAHLKEQYDGRIIGYDHPTVSVGPEQNAIDFLAQIPDGIKLTVDIVCHSRGGLVARALAGESSEVSGTSAKLDVRNIVFAATPNGGSEIAVRAHWAALLDRISSLLTLPTAALPPPVDEIATVLAGVLEVIKAVSVDTEVQLPGLENMDPSDPFYDRLAAFAGEPPVYYAAASDFEPGPLLANLFHKIDDLARVLDRAVFDGVANDIAVPTDGVWDPGSVRVAGTPGARTYKGFPVADGNRQPLGVTNVYWHSAYFEDQAVRDALVRWLVTPDIP